MHAHISCTILDFKYNMKWGLTFLWSLMPVFKVHGFFFFFFFFFLHSAPISKLSFCVCSLCGRTENNISNLPVKPHFKTTRKVFILSYRQLSLPLFPLLVFPIDSLVGVTASVMGHVVIGLLDGLVVLLSGVGASVTPGSLGGGGEWLPVKNKKK